MELTKELSIEYNDEIYSVRIKFETETEVLTELMGQRETAERMVSYEWSLISPKFHSPSVEVWLEKHIEDNIQDIYDENY